MATTRANAAPPVRLPRAEGTERNPRQARICLRQRRCRAAGCRRYFALCRACDRGQAYCSPECRRQARRQQYRAAALRYQQTTRGRLMHRERQAAWRRRQRVGDSSGSAKPRGGLHARPLASGVRTRCLLCGCRGRVVTAAEWKAGRDRMAVQGSGASVARPARRAERAVQQRRAGTK